MGANPGNRIRSAFRENASVSRVESVLPSPSILTYTDLAESEVNTALTPGNIGVIDGYRLSFDPDMADEGVFFIDTTDASEYQVTDIQKNKPSQLVFLVPEILAGSELNLEVRSRFGEELRLGQLDGVLTV